MWDPDTSPNLAVVGLLTPRYEPQMTVQQNLKD